MDNFQTVGLLELFGVKLVYKCSKLAGIYLIKWDWPGPVVIIDNFEQILRLFFENGNDG